MPETVNDHSQGSQLGGICGPPLFGETQEGRRAIGHRRQPLIKRPPCRPVRFDWEDRLDPEISESAFPQTDPFAPTGQLGFRAAVE
ncbi:MAG: hypothetical protein F4Z28_00785 [Gammaproteobacteria bacterium]|nr:hypothetical protein [Gammaproteobacteria bacterium]